MLTTIRKHAFGVVISAAALLTTSIANAQMNIALVPTADPEVFEFHWTAEAAYSGIMNSVFSIRWDASAGGEISEDDFVNVCSNTRAPLLTNDLPVQINGGFRYYTFRSDGASALGTTAQCGFSAGQTRVLHRFRIEGISGCPNIGLTNDAYVTGLNRNYFVSVGGVSATGTILSGQIGVPFTVTPGSYGPTCSTGAAINLVGSPAGGTWSGVGVTGNTFSPSAGTQTLNYSVTQGGCTVSANTTITVNTAPSAGTLSGTQAICVGGNSTFSSTVAGGSWTSNSTGVATINPSTGAISGVSAGTATMTYTVTGTGGCTDATATRTVTVTAAPSAGTLSGTQGICVGGNSTFSSTVAGGSWTSNSTGVATINPSTGAISGVSAGTATMTYTVTGTGGCSNATATRTVTVTAAPSAGTLSGTQTICVGGNSTFSSTVAGGSWISNNTGVATINPSTGAISGVSAGTATMTYTVTGTGGCSNATATRTVTVTAAPSAGTLSGTQTICVGGNSTFSSTVAGGSWLSSNTGVATINASTGAISGLSEGTVTMTYTVAGTGGCSDATATRTLTVSPTSDNTTTISACDTYTWAVNGQTYTQSGTYTSTTGCATETLVLTIVTSTNNSTTVSACDSYTWNINGQTYTQSGTYQSVSGCGTQTLILTITPSTNTPTTISACDSYTWAVNGQTYTQSGTYTSTTDCATQTLNLTITPSTNTPTTISACDSYTWAVNGQTYTQSGTYTSTTDCATQTLNLTITPSTNTPTTISACDSYTWAVNGQTYAQSGTYTSTTGCATQTLNLIITESTNNITTVTECDSYTWSVNGETYTQSGTYTETDGCETETLVLTIVSSSNNVTTISACDSYTWSINGETYTQSGTYTSVSGCGTQTLELTITPSSTNSTPLSVCGASYTWPINGQTYTQSGSYTALNGCVTEVLVLTLTVPGTPCDDGNSGTINDTWSQNCTCVGTPVGCEQFVNLIITTDGNGGQTTWEIIPEGGGAALCTGGPYTGINNATLGEQCCLVDGCYALRVYDSAGDGMTTGGYVLKEGGQQGRRIIDNSGDGVFGSVSAIAGGQGFCLPLGDDRLIFAHCDREFWEANQYIVATENPAVSAMWVVGGANGVQPSNSGYEFWIFDPDGTYSYRRFRSHNVSDGYSPASALRACHMKVNSWFANALNPHIPSNVLMNVRIRGRVAGSNLPFGPACRFKIDPALAQCPPTALVNTPGTLEFSCGVVKPFGTNTSKVYAWSRPGANRYQFEFTVPGEGNFLKVVTSTNNVATLNWTVDALVPGVTYDVRVRVSKNQGATWCPWGEVCYVTIENNVPAASIEAPATEGVLSTGLAKMEVIAWPNPNRGDRITLAVTNLEASVERIGVELYDLTGKRILADMIAAQDGMVNTNIELNNTQSGVYLLRVTAGDVVTTDRIVVQH